MPIARPVPGLIVAVAFSVASTAAALAWDRDLSMGEGKAIALTDSGDVTVAGALFRRRLGRVVGGLGVAKLRGDTGTILWRRIFRGEAQDVAVDSRGNALVAASGRLRHFTVMKLGSRDGALRWRYEATSGSARAIATDAEGDVLASGSLGIDTTDWIVVKVAGSKGTERWRHVIPGGESFAVAVDAVGDVIAAGRTTRTLATTSLTVIKLAGEDGTILWRQDMVAGAGDRSGSASAVRLDPAGDVVVAGWTGGRLSPLQSDFAVAKLAGTSGAELWRKVFSDPEDYAYATDVAVDRDGAVVAVGGLPKIGRTDTDFTAVKLDPRDGRELWRVAIDGTLHRGDGAFAVAIDSVGAVATAGYVQNATTGSDFVVARLDGADGRELSRRTIGGSRGDTAFAVAVDGEDRVVATGSKWCESDEDAYFAVSTLPAGTSSVPASPCPIHSRH